MTRSWQIGLVAAFCCAFAAVARADITVRGMVYYWDGYERDLEAGTIGAWRPAVNTQIDVENDCLAVLDTTTYTNWAGQYSTTFEQRFFRPDFNHLRVNIEVRADVRLEKGDRLSREGPDEDICVTCYKGSGWPIVGAARLFPLNGQTGNVYIRDNETQTINVYLGPSECPDPPAATAPKTANLRVTSWDYDDDGRLTTAGVFMCQCAQEAYSFMTAHCAKEEELRRSASIFYPEKSDANVVKPDEGSWIDMRKRGLFTSDMADAEDRWGEWLDLRCTFLHEFSHKIMHDVYWTLPKKYPWGQSANPFSDETHEHDLSTCRTGEMGISEGWANFLPAVINQFPTIKACRVIEVETETTVNGIPVQMTETHVGNNIERSWYPEMPSVATDPGYLDVPGAVAWRADITGRRDWNEGEVAAVLWDIYDGPGWEYMPQAEQDKKPADWPGDLRWHDCLSDIKLHAIWDIIREEPECLNDEDEAEFTRDSFWTFWLEKHGSDRRLVHGLKAIMHNREMRHTLRPENAPQLVQLRALPGCTTVPFAELKAEEKDEEDRPFPYYNIAYSKGGGAMKLLLAEDAPLECECSDEELTGRVRLPDRSEWDHLVAKLNDSMTCTFQAAEGGYWQDDSEGDGPPIRLIDAKGSGTIAVGGGGSVWIWGREGGRSGPAPRGHLAEWGSRAVQVPGFYGAVAVAHGRGHYMALKGDGTVWTWGQSSNSSGALGIGDAKPLPDHAPNQVAGLSDIVMIDADIDVSMALKSDGTVWAWGHNTACNLGDGTRVRRRSPVQVQGLIKKITAISTCGSYSLAADEDGEVWAWGGPARGHIDTWGLGFPKLPLTGPVKIHGLRNIVAVDAGGEVAIALDSDGAVWELGDRAGPHTTLLDGRFAPGKVPGLPKITAIASGGTHHYALAESGKVWSWGRDNRADRLGDEERRKLEDCKEPAPVKAGCYCVAIAAAGGHAAAVARDGHALTWGDGRARADGQVEDGFATVLGHAFRTDIRPGRDPDFQPFVLYLFR